jgi:hypothetical protein
MAKIATTKPFLSAVLMSDSTSLVPDYNYSVVSLKEAADTVYKLGQVVVYNGVDAYRVLKNTDFTSDSVLTAPAGIPSLPNGSAWGVVVGFDSLGGEFDATIGTTARKAHVLFRGAVGVKDTHADGGLVFDAGVVAARRTLIKRLMEQEGLDIKPVLGLTEASLYGYRSY